MTSVPPPDPIPGEVPAVPLDPPPGSATPTPKPESAVKFTRAAALWSALAAGFVILIILLVFIMQNTDSISIDFFGWEWNLPLGVAILLSAVCGGLLTFAVGVARIVQLRRAAKKNLKAGL
ncbi:lipopolysaccharide assembly protein LapA domain-containing protein [Mycobacterium sp. B14F4]|uniref:LapA family protein n=1 Tax=Mycobacterium sp. B14F4 TaxID=3153565 RepID=UPI00325E1DE8